LQSSIIHHQPSTAARIVLRRTHLLSTVWFIACMGYLLVSVLQRLGFQWWLIFSLSGLSAPVVLFLGSLYLFALYRGIGEAQQIEIEHPLTTTSYYMALYVAAPLLGGLAGTLGSVGVVTEPGGFLLGVVLGTLAVTIAIWVVVDPILGSLEMLLPASRRHRTQRLAQAEAQRRARQEKREHLLAEAFAREERDRQQWQQRLQGQAQRLAVLLTCDAQDFARAEREAVDIGAQAWRLGGLSCMRQLHDMTMEAAQGGHKTTPSFALPSPSSDYLSFWWDGIGDWRKPSLD
jgi:hypothetical protein